MATGTAEERLDALEARCAGMENDIIRLEGERAAARLRLDAQDETIRALNEWVAELHEACAATFVQTGKLTSTETDVAGKQVTVEHDVTAPWRAAPLSGEGERERRRDAIERQLDEAKAAGAALMADAAPSSQARVAATAATATATAEVGTNG